jgi:putative transposase
MTPDLAGPIPAPRLRLVPYSVAKIGKRECIIERYINGKWAFLAPDNEPLHYTDRQLVDMQAAGSFTILSQPGRQIDTPTPPHPLNVGEKAHARNLRKLNYVSACKADPDYNRSRRVLLPVIERVAAERRATSLIEKTPSFSTVLGWLDRYEKYGALYGAAALCDRHDLKGNYRARLAEYQLQAIDAGVQVWLKLKTTAVNAYATACAEVAKIDKSGAVDKSRLDPKLLDEEGCLKPPSLREFERRCERVDPATRDALRIGARYVRKNYRTFSTMSLPDRPYKDVEVDHCTLDLLLKHESGIILGRPDLIVFKDRATSMILGWGLGFDQPSYASFLKGLENAMYGPDLSHLTHIKNVPTWFGRIENLYHDNALHFTGESIKAAALQLGINLVRLQPRQPWLKGALEGWNRKLGLGLVHNQPGTTLEHAVARRDYETLGEATLTISQFEALFARWVCDVYNAAPTKALGFIRGVNDGVSPLEAWASKSRDYESDILPSRDLFIALAGLIEERSIQRNGIQIDYIVYEGPMLTRVIGNPKHRRKPTHNQATRYKVARDPHDLGHVFLVHHHTGERLEIPACAAHADYAKGLTLTEHEIIVAKARQRRGKRVAQFKDLQETRAELNKLAVGITKSEKFKTVQRRLARWFEGGRIREQTSRVKTFAPDGTDYLVPQSEPLNAQVVRSPEMVLSTPIQTFPLSDEEALTSLVGNKNEPDDLDIAELRLNKNWE